MVSGISDLSVWSCQTVHLVFHMMDKVVLLLLHKNVAPIKGDMASFVLGHMSWFGLLIYYY